MTSDNEIEMEISELRDPIEMVLFREDHHSEAWRKHSGSGNRAKDYEPTPWRADGRWLELLLELPNPVIRRRDGGWWVCRWDEDQPAVAQFAQDPETAVCKAWLHWKRSQVPA